MGRSPVKSNPNQPDEKIVGPGDMLIFVSGERPIYGVQILFFLDEEFKRRAAILAPKADSTSLYTPPSKPERPRSMVIDADPAATEEFNADKLEYPTISPALLTKPLARKHRAAEPTATLESTATAAVADPDQPEEVTSDEYTGYE